MNKGASMTIDDTNALRQANDGHSEDLRIAMVDDVSLYSKRLLSGFKHLGIESVLYGPITSPSSKPHAIMETMGPEGLHVWNQYLFPLQILWRAMRDGPRVVHVQFEFYGIHSYGPLYASIGIPVLLLLLRLVGVKRLVTLHSVLPTKSSQLKIIRDTSPNGRRVPTGLLGAFLILSYKLIALGSSALIVHADIFKKRLVDQYQIRPSKVLVIPHGVDVFNRSDMTTNRLTIPEEAIVLYFGVISPRKGLENLLSAFSILAKQTTNCSLLLAGTSPPYYEGYEQKVKNLAAELGVNSKVRFLGSVSNDLAHELFMRAMFIVLPYSYDISASGAMSWALGHGLPVIASENDYFKEEMSEYPFGLMVPPGDPMALANAMELMISRGDLRAKFSESANRAGASRSWSTVAKATLGVYRGLFTAK
jgi:glycosyltransferase involved in cell wall biosynthesis